MAGGAAARAGGRSRIQRWVAATKCCGAFDGERVPLDSVEVIATGSCRRERGRVGFVRLAQRRGVRVQPAPRAARDGVDEIAARAGLGAAIAGISDRPAVYDSDHAAAHGEPEPVDRKGGTVCALLRLWDLDLQPRRCEAA